MPWELAMLIGFMIGTLVTAFILWLKVRHSLKQLGIFDIPVVEIKYWAEKWKKNN